MPVGFEEGILVVTPTFHPEKVGTPHYVTDLVRGLARAGAEPRVVTSQPYYPAFERFDGYGRRTRRDTLAGAPVYRVPTVVPRGGRAVWRAVSEVNFLIQVVIAMVTKRLPRAGHVIAVSPGVPFAVIAGSLVRRRGSAFVTVVHDVQFGLMSSTRRGLVKRLAGLARMVEVWALNRSSHVTVLSPAMGEALREAGVTAPISVVPLWPTVEPPDGAVEDEMLVLYSGNIGAKQGVAALVDAAERLAMWCPEARMVIRGQGAERPSLERDVAERGLGNVTFADFVHEDRLAESLARAAVHVVPQLPAGAAYAVPSKIYNILAVGRPVVVTAEPGSTLAQLAEEVEAVRIVPPGDTEALAAEIAKLLGDPAERHRIGRSAQEWMAATHSRDVAVAECLRLLQ